VGKQQQKPKKEQAHAQMTPTNRHVEVPTCGQDEAKQHHPSTADHMSLLILIIAE
jgi:hypothetical protein